jgi:hypothetical protein
MVKTYIKLKFSKDDKKIDENFSCTK